MRDGLTVPEQDVLCKASPNANCYWELWEPTLFDLSVLERLHELKLVEVVSDTKWVTTDKGSWLVTCWMNDDI